MEPGQDQENPKAAKNISVPRRVQNAIRQCQGTDGVTYPELKKFLQDSKKLDVGVWGAEIKLALKNGVDRGILTKESGLYKVKETARRRRSRSGSKGRKKSRRRRSKRKSSKRRKSPRRKSTKRKRSGSRRRRRKPAAVEE